MPSLTRLMTTTIKSTLDANTSHPGFAGRLADSVILANFIPESLGLMVSFSKKQMHICKCTYTHTYLCSLKEDHWLAAIHLGEFCHVQLRQATPLITLWFLSLGYFDLHWGKKGKTLFLAPHCPFLVQLFSLRLSPGGTLAQTLLA